MENSLYKWDIFNSDITRGLANILNRYCLDKAVPK